MAVAPDAWEVACRGALAPLARNQRTVLENWTAKGWPVIVRRRSVDDAADRLPTAVPLPPSLGKLRFATALPPIAAKHPPVTLFDAAGTAPTGWRASVDALLRLEQRFGLRSRVYGALLWQHLTGLEYLHPASDLDLLWPVADAAVLAPLLAGLRGIEAGGDVRLDGEIILPDGGGVNWRELHRAGSAADVMVKRLDGVTLCHVGALLPASARTAS